MFESRPFDLPPYRGHISASPERPDALPALKDYPELLQAESAETLHDGRNKIIAVLLPGAGEAVIKIFKTRGLRKIKTLVLPSKGFQAWTGAVALFENGFGTAFPIAAFERRCRGVAVESVFIAERVRGDREIREWFRESPEPALRELLAALAPVLARLHRTGIVHRDLSDGNILVRGEKTSGFQFIFLDTNRVRRRRSLGCFSRARNLVRLGVPPALQPFFLDQYAAAAGPEFSGKRLGSYYRTAKKAFEFWLGLKKSLRLRALSRKLGLQ